MKYRITMTLAVLVLAAMGVLNEFTTKMVSARSAPDPQLITAATTTPVAGAPMSATCFCRVIANGTEVAKPTKGGYVQPIQAEACRNYCRGLWDGNQSQRVAWAHLAPNACGNVSLKMDAALGTMGYQTVRNETETGINGTHLVSACPSGQQVSIPFGGTSYCIPLTYIPLALPNQLMGAYLVQFQRLYQILGPAGTKCV
jgi:hypothetical protein